MIKFASDALFFVVRDSDLLQKIHPRLLELFLLLDRATRQHSFRVRRNALHIGTLLGLPPRELEQLATAALFHDIGKIAIGHEILNKRAALTSLEYRKIRMHPKIGASLWLGFQRDTAISEAILAHHERFAGGGYPFGRVGQDIPQWSRIISIADALDAMTTRRTYREPLRYDQALHRLDMASNSQFDPVFVNLYLSHCTEPPAAKMRFPWPSLYRKRGSTAPALLPALLHDRNDGDPTLN